MACLKEIISQSSAEGYSFERSQKPKIVYQSLESFINKRRNSIATFIGWETREDSEFIKGALRGSLYRLNRKNFTNNLERITEDFKHTGETIEQIVTNYRKNPRATTLRIIIPIAMAVSYSACNTLITPVVIEPERTNTPEATLGIKINFPTPVLSETPTKTPTPIKSTPNTIAIETKTITQTATGTSTPTETSKLPKIPALKIVNGHVDWPSNNLELDKFAEQKGSAIVPFVEPGDFIGQVGRNKYVGDFILKKDGTIIFVPKAVSDEYFRIKSVRSQVFSSDRTLYFEASDGIDARGRRISEIRRSAVIDSYSTGPYIVVARCDMPNCLFRHPPAVDPMGLYGVAIKNTENVSYLHLFEVNPHHNDTLYQAPAGWSIDRVGWGSGLEENDIFMEMFHLIKGDSFSSYNIDLRGYFRLKDAVEHNHFPPFVRDSCSHNDPNKPLNPADHCMMEYNKYNITLQKYLLRPADKLPKLEMMFSGPNTENFPFNLTPIERPSSLEKNPALREYTIKVTK